MVAVTLFTAHDAHCIRARLKCLEKMLRLQAACAGHHHLLHRKGQPNSGVWADGVCQTWARGPRARCSHRRKPQPHPERPRASPCSCRSVVSPFQPRIRLPVPVAQPSKFGVARERSQLGVRATGRPKVVVFGCVECIFIAAAQLEETGKVDETSIACLQSVNASSIFSSEQPKWRDKIY